MNITPSTTVGKFYLAGALWTGAGFGMHYATYEQIRANPSIQRTLTIDSLLKQDFPEREALLVERKKILEEPQLNAFAYEKSQDIRNATIVLKLGLGTILLAGYMRLAANRFAQKR